MGSLIEVGKFRFEINGANGVSLEHKYFNTTDKVIKYITFSYVPYNAVGDKVSCTVRDKVVSAGKLTGPINPKREGRVKWDTLWYNPTVSRIVLVQIDIDYMDGTNETIDGSDVVSMDDENSVYYQTVTKPWKEKCELERIEREKKAELERAEREKQEEIKKRKETLKQSYICFMVFRCMKKVKGDEELAFHVNQGLWLFILEAISFILAAVIPGIGTLIFLVLIGLSIFLITKANNAIDKDERFEIPILSKIKLVKP